MHQARTFGIVVALATLLASAAGAAATDHFVCYAARPAASADHFAPRSGVRIADAVGAATAAVRKPGYLCAPADLNGGDPSAPAHPDHLEDYRIQPASPNGAVVDVCGGAPCLAP